VRDDEKTGRSDVTKLTAAYLKCSANAPEDVVSKYELHISTYYPVFAWRDLGKLQTASLQAENNVASPDYKRPPITIQTLRKKLKVRNSGIF
jgi:hypothetical protein